MNPNCPLPNNLNPLSPTGFTLSITKLPEISFFCQNVIIPDISLDNIPQATPFSQIKIPGELLKFSDLTVNFIVDENMANYTALWNWLIGLGFPENYTQYQSLVSTAQNSTSTSATPAIPAFGQLAGNFSDGSLTILGSNNTPVRTIIFTDLHPVSLGSLEFQSNVDDIQYLVGSATFGYTYYVIT